MPLDNKSEMFCLVDENDNEIGKISRGEAHSDRSKIHRSIAIIITNSKNQILLQKRSKHKDKDPGFWTLSCSGHVSYGETYLQSAVRELKEEVGISTNLQEIGKLTIKEPDETEINMIYTGNYQKSDFQPDHTEVEEMRWVEIIKISDFISQNQVTKFAQIVLKHTGYIT